jgi:hypothetical protein
MVCTPACLELIRSPFQRVSYRAVLQRGRINVAITIPPSQV